MNERINLLATEAGMAKFPPSIETEFQKNILFGDQHIEKFAELIVRDGVTAITNDTANYPGEAMMAYYQGVQDAAKALKRHFGVE